MNAQISDSSDSEEDVQYPYNSLKADHKVYLSMENNEQYERVKYPSQFYRKYRCSLKHHCVMVKLIF